MVNIERGTYQLAEELFVRGIRQDDIEEAIICTNIPFEQAYWISVQDAVDTNSLFSISINRKPVGICGCTPPTINRHFAVPWLIVAPEFSSKNTSMAVARICKRLADNWHEKYGLLMNVKSSESKHQNKMLKFCGFSIEREPFTTAWGTKCVRFWR